jgi:hypothetical protein
VDARPLRDGFKGLFSMDSELVVRDAALGASREAGNAPVRVQEPPGFRNCRVSGTEQE